MRIGALVGDGERTELPVPATPAWTVHDVVAHLVGVAEDASTGNMAGAPGDAWTAGHVARGAGRTVAALVEAWVEPAAVVESFLSSPAGGNAAAAVMDIHTHEADLRHALGLAPDMPADFVAWVGAEMREMFASSVAEAGLAPVTVTVGDRELFRARLGRRTEAEVRAYDWSSDPAPYLDACFLFGRAEQSLGPDA